MIRLIAVAGFALAVATSAEAMTPAPIYQAEGMVTSFSKSAARLFRPRLRFAKASPTRVARVSIRCCSG
jgi:hypothetical protein